MVALHVQTRNDGQCLKRWHLREDHIARKKPIPYIKSTKACKVERIRTLKRMVAMEAHEKECHRKVARDPQLVILNKEVYHKDPASKSLLKLGWEEGWGEGRKLAFDWLI